MATPVLPELTASQRVGGWLLGAAGIAGVAWWIADRAQHRVHAPPGNWVSVVIAEALAQIGKPYLWGGSGPESFDCSGLMNYVFRAAGITMPRTADAIYRAVPHVGRDHLRPGDMVFFGSPGFVHHVGLYIGNGKMIHAPHGGATVSVADVSGMGDFVAGGRVA
jgi:cell wall-associated NlpC family hydrolase